MLTDVHSSYGKLETNKYFSKVELVIEQPVSKKQKTKTQFALFTDAPFNELTWQ